MALDRITRGLLDEFGTEFGVADLPEDRRFEHMTAWITTRRHYNDAQFDPADIVTGSGGDTGIDGIAIIVNNNLVTDVDTITDLLELNGYLDVTFVFIQAERSSGFDMAKIGQFGFGVKDFFADGKLPRNDLVQSAREVMEAIYTASGKFKPGNPACFLYYVTAGKWQADPALVVRADNERSDLLATQMFSKVEFVPVGADQIQALYRQTKSTITREFTFDQKVVVPDVQGVKEAYIGLLKANDFLALVCDTNGQIIKSLFYENIRDWIGYNAINTEIQHSLISNQKDRFALMNNGVTMIARELKVTGNKFTVQDFQVVNGCQTSHVLHDNRILLDDSVRIPFRLVCTQDENVIESVIRATNRQAEVRDDQFFAMKDFAKRVEAYFKTMTVEHRVYYERRPHQYDSQDIERMRVITHQNLVRAVGAMFLGEPHITTRTFRQLAAKVGKEMFKETDRLEPYYVSAYALYRLEQAFKKTLDAKYKPARYQILLIARLLMDGAPLPKMNSKEMEKRCDAMLPTLYKDKDTAHLFLTAAGKLDEVAGSGWNRDTIRTDPITKAIFQKFGQKNWN